MSLAADDHRYIWHPFTQQQGWVEEEPVIIESADGTTLTDSKGRHYIDGVSSLWCNVHGHRHPKIDRAIQDQLAKVAHSTMLGLSHRPGIELAKRLIGIAPTGLSRVFFSDSGSTAVEIALKMAFQFWAQHRDTAGRAKFISLEDGYHGDTLGSVSAGGIELFHETYRPLLFDTLKAKPGVIADVQRLLAENEGEVAAVLIEPLVQGAAGMIMHPPGYLAAIRSLCDRYGALLICDEVATGFGRTGTMFACEQEGVTPDVMCVAKGITGGYLPLAATLTSERIYEGFLGRYDEYRTFFHGHTYTGNPLACAAAIAALDVFEEERTLESLPAKIGLLERLLEPIAQLDCVREVRQRGFMVGIELDGFDPALRMGHEVTLEARARGAIVRPLGDVIVLMPPLSIEGPELQRLVSITRQAIEAAQSQLAVHSRLRAA